MPKHDYVESYYIVQLSDDDLREMQNYISKLKEKDYDDIEEEKFSTTSSKGWLGITDKYWLTALVPEKGKEFKSEFSFKGNKYRANYIIKDVSILNPGSEITNEVNIVKIIPIISFQLPSPISK